MVKSFPYHKAFGVQGFVAMLTWNTSLCITHTFSPATCTSTLEVRELGSLYGGVFSFADCDLWACAVGGDALRLHFLPVRGRGAGQGMDWGKREQWAIEIYTVLRFTMQLCGPASLSPSTLGTPPLVKHRLPPRTFKAKAFTQSERDGGGGRNSWEEENGMKSEREKRSQGRKAMFINKEQRGLLAVWPCRYKVILLRFGFLQRLPPTVRESLKWLCRRLAALPDTYIKSSSLINIKIKKREKAYSA